MGFDELLKKMSEMDSYCYDKWINWLEEQKHILEPSGSEASDPPSEILDLLLDLRKVLVEKGLYVDLEETDEVTQYCTECEHEVTMQWNCREDGLKAFCPYCGNRLMLCDWCPRRNNCDYDADTDTCFYNQCK